MEFYNFDYETQVFIARNEKNKDILREIAHQCDDWAIFGYMFERGLGQEVTTELASILFTRYEKDAQNNFEYCYIDWAETLKSVAAAAGEIQNEKILINLATIKFDNVRQALAESVIPEKIQMILAKDKNLDIICSIAANTMYPDVLKAAYEHEDKNVKWEVVFNEKVPTEIIKDFTDNFEENIENPKEYQYAINAAGRCMEDLARYPDDSHKDQYAAYKKLCETAIRLQAEKDLDEYEK